MSDLPQQTSLFDDVEIVLPTGEVAIVSWEDRDLAEFSWRRWRGRNTEVFYAVRNIWAGNNKYKTLRLHRLILERMIERQLKPKEFTDHVNGNGLDNRRQNLRVCTKTENTQNSRRRSDNASGYKGVYWHKQSQSYRAQIRVNGRDKHLGSFSDAESAHQAYVEAAKQYFGEFARAE